jgi:hypothetical protein
MRGEELNSTDGQSDGEDEDDGEDTDVELVDEIVQRIPGSTACCTYSRGKEVDSGGKEVTAIQGDCS